MDKRKRVYRVKGILREYKNYEDYVAHQKKKTEDPTRREKWLGEEWEIKLIGFMKEFNKLLDADLISKNDKALCLGARTGQEVFALNKLGLNAIGIDLVPCEPLVVEGDIHNLHYQNETYDFVFTNILDHSLKPDVMMKEIERVLKPDGIFLLQMQVNYPQDEFTEFVPESIQQIFDMLANSKPIHANWIFEDKTINAHGMNFEIVFRKNNEDTV